MYLYFITPIAVQRYNALNSQTMQTFIAVIMLLPYIHIINTPKLCKDVTLRTPL